MSGKGAGRIRLGFVTGLVGIAMCLLGASADARALRTKAEWNKAATLRIGSYSELYKRNFPLELHGRFKTFVSASVARDGSVSKIRVVKSSGHDVLDKFAMSVLRSASPLAPFTPDMGQGSQEITLPVIFVLADRRGAYEGQIPKGAAKVPHRQ